jgi:hypothetical protein
MSKKLALIILFFILGTVLLFHFLIFLEHIPYDKVWAGKLNSVEEMKSFEAFSILLNAFILTVLYIKYRHLAKGVKNAVIDVLIWAFSVFFLLNTAGNLFSKNMIELIFGTFLSLTCTILCVIIAKKRIHREVIKQKIRLSDSQKSLFTKIDFIDTFSTTNHSSNIEEITTLIFNTTPKWINSLFALRNRIAGLFGYGIELPRDYNENFKVGEYIKFFKIYSISDNEVILGADDSHLNFRVLIIDDKSSSHNIKVITIVEFNNLKGKIYMSVINPFHKLIVRRMVKNAYNEI